MSEIEALHVRLAEIADFAQELADKDREVGWCEDIARDLRALIPLAATLERREVVTEYDLKGEHHRDVKHRYVTPWTPGR